MKRIYFDYSASTPMDPRVREAMQPYLGECFGNPSSLHWYGRDARQSLEDARGRLAALMGAGPEEIVFTSGGTESNNLALKGYAFANRARGTHLIISSIEHECVMNSCRWLIGQGFTVTALPVDGDGLVDPGALEAAITPQTILVSIMHANNEIGALEPLEELGEVCRRRGVSFHSDACQSFGKVRIDLRRQPVDLLTVNAHKIYGPKGVGALYIRGGVRIGPWQHGGGHERGLRSSTENVPGIVGFALAAELCHEGLDAEVARLTALRDRIIDRVCAEIPRAYLNGHRTRRLCNNVNLGFRGCEGEAIRLLLLLDDLGVAVSTGSACSSNDAERTPSHVLTAIGRNPLEARGALRISIGRYTTGEEVDCFLDLLPGLFHKLRPLSSVA